MSSFEQVGKQERPREAGQCLHIQASNDTATALYWAAGAERQTAQLHGHQHIATCAMRALRRQDVGYRRTAVSR